jgi:hypothetical protein
MEHPGQQVRAGPQRPLGSALVCCVRSRTRSPAFSLQYGVARLNPSSPQLPSPRLPLPLPQVVVLSKVFAGDINTGYQDLCNVQLLRVDGVDVVNLGHAAALIEAAKGPFVKLELEWNKVRPRRQRFASRQQRMRPLLL